jgi:hypothetical protein
VKNRTKEYDSGLVGATTALTPVTGVDTQVTDLFVTNSTGAQHTVTIADGGGAFYVKDFVLPANSTMQVITGSTKGFWFSGGVQVQADADNAINVQVAGYQ